jgi:hypothetical protein
MTVMPLAEMSKFGEDKNLTNAPKSRKWLFTIDGSSAFFAIRYQVSKELRCHKVLFSKNFYKNQRRAKTPMAWVSGRRLLRRGHGELAR